jgi:hypothetical protein
LFDRYWYGQSHVTEETLKKLRLERNSHLSHWTTRAIVIVSQSTIKRVISKKVDPKLHISDNLVQNYWSDHPALPEAAAAIEKIDNRLNCLFPLYCRTCYTRTGCGEHKVDSHLKVKCFGHFKVTHFAHRTVVIWGWQQSEKDTLNRLRYSIVSIIIQATSSDLVRIPLFLQNVFPVSEWW